MFKKMTDERLQLQNLKNIRVVFIIQTIGILSILAYDAFTKGLDAMRENPLWLVFMVSAIVSAYLSMSISVDAEANQRNAQKSLAISTSVLLVIVALVTLLVARSEGSTLLDAVVVGGVLLVCGIIPIVYIYKLRKNRQADEE